MFLSFANLPISRYFKVREFSDLELFDLPTQQIFTNFELTEFSQRLKIRNVNYFAKLDVSSPSCYKVKDIVFPQQFEKKNPDLDLFKFLSSKFKLKCVMKIDL